MAAWRLRQSFRSKPARAAAAGLLGLVVIRALGTLGGDLLPGLVTNNAFNPLPPYEAQIVPFALLAAVAGAIAVVRRSPRMSFNTLLKSMILGGGLFVVPAILIQLADTWVYTTTRVAILTLTPLFALVLEPYLATAAVAPSSEAPRGAWLVSLIAVAGAFCVFPARVPGSIQETIAFAAVMLAAVCVAAANCYAVRVATQLPSRGLAPMTAMTALSAAMGFAIANVVSEHVVWRWTDLAPQLAPQLAPAVFIELPSLLLLFWLMRRMSAARMATRFLLAPSIAILAGSLLLHAPLTSRSWIGLIFMMGGALYILFAPATSENDSNPGSLHLR